MAYFELLPKHYFVLLAASIHTQERLALFPLILVPKGGPESSFLRTETTRLRTLFNMVTKPLLKFYERHT